MKTLTEIEEKVELITREHLGLNSREFDKHWTFADMGADSLDEIELAMLFDDEFGVAITDEQMALCRRPNKISLYVNSVLNPALAVATLQTGKTYEGACSDG